MKGQWKWTSIYKVWMWTTWMHSRSCFPSPRLWTQLFPLLNTGLCCKWESLLQSSKKRFPLHIHITSAGFEIIYIWGKGSFKLPLSSYSHTLWSEVCFKELFDFNWCVYQIEGLKTCNTVQCRKWLCHAMLCYFVPV